MSFSQKIYSTEDWGAVPARQTPRIYLSGGYIVVHHTGGKPSSGGTVAGGKNLARAIQKDHMKRVSKSGTPWIDSGHNFLNTIGGIVFEGRHRTLEAIEQGKCVQSAHSDNAVGNVCPGIENEGNYMTQTMTDVQWNSLVQLCADLCKALKINPSKIKGHRDFTATDCPGDWLYSQLPKLRTAVKAQLGK
jgi:hypothetical protein